VKERTKSNSIIRKKAMMEKKGYIESAEKGKGKKHDPGNEFTIH